MDLVGQRLKFLREKAHLTQAKMAMILGASQPAVNRYEHGQTAAPFSILRSYADYFDVSLDYIFGRCDEPQGKLYEHRPRIEQVNPDLKSFVDMCFDPASPMSGRLKEVLTKMLEEAEKEK